MEEPLLKSNTWISSKLIADEQYLLDAWVDSIVIENNGWWRLTIVENSYPNSDIVTMLPCDSANTWIWLQLELPNKSKLSILSLTTISYHCRHHQLNSQWLFSLSYPHHISRIPFRREKLCQISFPESLQQWRHVGNGTIMSTQRWINRRRSRGSPPCKKL